MERSFFEDCEQHAKSTASRIPILPLLSDARHRIRPIGRATHYLLHAREMRVVAECGQPGWYFDRLMPTAFLPEKHHYLNPCYQHTESEQHFPMQKQFSATAVVSRFRLAVFDHSDEQIKAIDFGLDLYKEFCEFYKMFLVGPGSSQGFEFIIKLDTRKFDGVEFMQSALINLDRTPLPIKLMQTVAEEHNPRWLKATKMTSPEVGDQYVKLALVSAISQIVRKDVVDQPPAKQANDVGVAELQKAFAECAPQDPPDMIMFCGYMSQEHKLETSNVAGAISRMTPPAEAMTYHLIRKRYFKAAAAQIMRMINPCAEISLAKDEVPIRLTASESVVPRATAEKFSSLSPENIGSFRSALAMSIITLDMAKAAKEKGFEVLWIDPETFAHNPFYFQRDLIVKAAALSTQAEMPFIFSHKSQSSLDGIKAAGLRAFPAGGCKLCKSTGEYEVTEHEFKIPCRDCSGLYKDFQPEPFAPGRTHWISSKTKKCGCPACNPEFGRRTEHPSIAPVDCVGPNPLPQDTKCAERSRSSFFPDWLGEALKDMTSRPAGESPTPKETLTEKLIGVQDPPPSAIAGYVSKRYAAPPTPSPAQTAESIVKESEDRLDALRLSLSMTQSQQHQAIGRILRSVNDTESVAKPVEASDSGLRAGVYVPNPAAILAAVTETLYDLVQNRAAVKVSDEAGAIYERIYPKGTLLNTECLLKTYKELSGKDKPEFMK